VVAFLYQQLTGTGTSARWQTRVQISKDQFNSAITTTLANTPANEPLQIFEPYLGDYTQILSIGKNFYGIFSASNRPDIRNFPTVKPIYQRGVDWTAIKLRDTKNVPFDKFSMDPFFFKFVF